MIENPNLQQYNTTCFGARVARVRVSSFEY